MNFKKWCDQNSFSLTFNKSEVDSSCSQKYLGLLLDKCLNFNGHIQRKMNNCYKIIDIMKKSSSDLTSDALFRISKSFD